VDTDIEVPFQVEYSQGSQKERAVEVLVEAVRESGVME